MGRKGLSVAVVALGLGLVALSVVADVVGIGTVGSFGWEQKAGVVVGMSLAWFAGLHLLGWSPRSRAARAPQRRVASAST